MKSNLKKESEESSILDDDKLLLDDSEPLNASPTKIAANETVNETCNEPPIEQPVISVHESSSQINLNKPLADIVIDLNEIRPHDEYAPLCILEEKSGLKIMLNFTKDKPRPDVAVLVITTTNHNKLTVKNFQFEASVSKVIGDETKI